MPNQIFNRYRLKITLALVLSFFLASFLKNELFVGDTAYLKMPPHEYLVYKIKTGLYLAKYGQKAKEIMDRPYTPSASTLKNMQEVAFQPLIKVSQGIYARTKGNVVQIEFREKEIEWVEYRFKIDGKERILRMPKDKKPPTQEEAEKIFMMGEGK